MGDRVSISFKNKDEESVALFSHWGGMAFVQKAREYVAVLQAERGKDSLFSPLDRLEPSTIVAGFRARCKRLPSYMDGGLGVPPREDCHWLSLLLTGIHH